MVIWEPLVNYQKIEFHKLPRRKGSKGEWYYAQEIAAFDIETTRLPELEQSFMYVWQFAIDPRLVIMGRSWDQFLHMMHQLKDRLGDLRLMIMVHNLSFEGQFLSSPRVYKFSNDEVFAIDSRKLLRLTMFNESFEFRCSYRLFNLSLDAITHRFGCQYAKRSGTDFDYDKIRTPSTPLSHRELLYCVYDVLGLTEAMRHQLKLHGDTLYTLPYTQTGYVRREAKRSMRIHRQEIRSAFPDERLFTLLRNAFRGGNTHGNRYYVGEIINNVHGIDISSSYPTQQVLEKYPITPFSFVGAMSLSGRYLDKMLDRGNAVLMRVRFWDLELRYRYEPIPYLARAKCITRLDKKDLIVDNGRILSSRRGCAVEVALTDIDFKIVESQYRWSRMEILEMYTSTYGPMFDGLRDLNISLFRDKTRLKGDDSQKIYYDRAKEMLNSIYGMSCQNPLQPAILFSDPDTGEYTVDYKEDDSKSTAQLLTEARDRAFLVYQLGVWTTAHARAELQRVIDLHKDYVIYCDTDSVMYTGEISGLAEVNAEYVRRDEEAGAFGDDRNGERHYMGVFENEDDPRHDCKFDRFVTMGAKKYAFEKHDKKTDDLYVGITVAGVPKKAGGKELAAKGGLEMFAKPPFIFDECGKLSSIYNDKDYGEVTVNGEKVFITRNVTLSPTTYELGLEKDYASLIKQISEEQLQKIIRDCQY